LLLNYFGQGAWLLTLQGKTLGNEFPFMPSCLSSFSYWESLWQRWQRSLPARPLSPDISLINEAIKLSYGRDASAFSKRHPRTDVYPAMNWILMGGSILVIVIFKESSAMEGLMGLRSRHMLMTTSLLCSISLRQRSRVFDPHSSDSLLSLEGMFWVQPGQIPARRLVSHF